ncbi:serine/threonine-protein kinase [Paracraurococcus lichenis]|uniref:Uncharacterized protein n=1 Tax=Paracraurococcus lichenis TaxID=3064888 RepID=A0ABT9E190_9PROT|nr:hypothetical protein [Paracraurococcus sp. LOR1-02]MDO9709785.1 hypothetical protein [Paracraurococcus sp. LOR1-02]
MTAPQTEQAAAIVEAALRAAQDLARLPALPAPLARLVLRHNAEAVERRFAAAALTMAEIVDLLAALADRVPAEALVPARAWALMRIEQYGAVAMPPGLPRALLRGLGEAVPGPDRALGRAWARQGFREGIWAAGLHRVPLLPLGLNCLPWNLPARWGFRAAAEAMEAFNPFALASHRLPAVLAALEEGWVGYAPAGGIRSIATPSGARVLLREDGGAVWNHHTGPHWEEDDFATLRLDLEVLARRFERLAASPRLPLRVAFLLTEEAAPDAALAERVLAALRRRARGGRVGLVLLHNPPAGEAGEAPSPPGRLGPDALLLRVPAPRPGYQWHLPAHFDTPEGHAFEQRIANALRDAVAGWLG